MAREASQRTLGMAVAVLLALQAALLLDSSRHTSVTLDEYCHLPAGLVAWRTGQFFAYKVNPPLTKLWAALPVLGTAPDLDTSGICRPEGDCQFAAFGQAFLDAAGPAYFELYRVARLPNILLTLAGGWLVWHWSCQLYGPRAGLLSLALWCLCPNILAHGQLITPDIGTTVLGLLASYVFWCYLQTPSRVRAVGVGLVLGVAELTKFSLLILYPSWAAIWMVWAILRPPGASASPSRPAWSWRVQALDALILVALSGLVVNAGYGFEGSFTRLGDYEFISGSLRGLRPDQDWCTTAPDGTRAVNAFQHSILADLPVPLPRHYVLGIDRQKADFERGLHSYLRGELRREGWWYYYLYALLIKTPLGTLLLLATTLVLSLRGQGVALEDELALLLPGLALLVFVSSQTGFNHHLRYVLPCLPYLFIWCGKVASDDVRMQAGSFARWALPALVILALGGNAVSVLRLHPHHLAYFNELVGGPDHGAEHLSNSNIDWGQDLFALKAWIDAHPEAQGLGVAYFGFVDPGIVGIRYHLPPQGPTSERALNEALGQEFGPQPGWYAISITLLHGLPFTIPNGQGGFLEAPTHAYRYFARFQPVARAGHSILIYHLTRDEVDAARAELGLPPLAPQGPRAPGAEHRADGSG